MIGDGEVVVPGAVSASGEEAVDACATKGGETTDPLSLTVSYFEWTALAVEAQKRLSENVRIIFQPFFRDVGHLGQST